MPFLKLENAELHYEIIGSGPSLLMIAGLASDGASWAPIIEDLSSQFQLILADNRGSGQTKDDGGPIDPHNWITDLVALCNHLNLDQFSIIGHSMGGAIGYRLASALPDRIDALITLAAANTPSAKARMLTRDMVAARNAGLSDDLWLRLFFQFLFAPPFFEDENRVSQAVQASLTYEHTQSATDFARQIEAIDRLAAIDLSALTIPTLAITGEADILVPPDEVNESLMEHPISTTLQIEGAGHSIHWDKPKETLNAIRMYLTD